MTCKHGLDREIVECLQCDADARHTRVEQAFTKEREETKRFNAYSRLVLALRNLLEVPTDDNHAAVRIELRRTARLLLSDLGELKVCQHGSGRVTPDGWECSACGQVFKRGEDIGSIADPLSPAHAWPDIEQFNKAHVFGIVPEFLKRKVP